MPSTRVTDLRRAHIAVVAQEISCLREAWLQAEFRLTKAMPAHVVATRAPRRMKRAQAKKVDGLFAEVRLAAAAYFAAVHH